MFTVNALQSVRFVARVATLLSLTALFAPAVATAQNSAQASADSAFPFQERVISIFEKNRDSVVKIYAQKRFILRDKDGNTAEKTVLDAGSGFFIGKDGVAMTSAFVVMGAEKLWIKWRGILMDAQIVGLDPLTTVAIIRPVKSLKAMNPPVVMIDGTSRPARPATFLLSLACEYGLPSAPRMGMLAGWNIEFGGAFLPTVYLRTNILCVRGSMGGAVFDMSGRFVGMTIAAIPETGGSFVLPANAAARIRDDILLCGEPVYSWFGLQAQDTPDCESGSKIAVTLVAENGPAKKAGFKEGDIIESIDGVRVSDNTELREKTFFVRPGQASKIVVKRNGESIALEITAQRMSGDIVKARLEHLRKEALKNRETGKASENAAANSAENKSAPSENDKILKAADKNVGANADAKNANSETNGK